MMSAKSFSTHHSSLFTYHFFISRTERCPVIRGRRLESVPVVLEAVGQLLHLGEQGAPLALERAQVVAVGLVLREREHFAVAQFAQDGDVRLANGRAQLAAAREG